MKIPKTIYSLRSNIMFVAGLTLFVMFFTIIYTPNYGISEEATSLSDMGEMGTVILLWYRHQALCLPVTCAIILGVTALSRTLLLLLTRTARLGEGEYLLWQLGEVIATALFIHLFLSLHLHLGYLENLPLVLLVYVSVAIYPYTFYWLLSERMDRDIRIAEAQRTIVRLRQGQEKADKNILRFADDKATVRLVVSSDMVVSIEGAGNYVTILYIGGNRLMRYSLRNTLKGIENLCSGGPLVRCHRSYYINLDKVKLLRKTADGLYAEMDCEGVDDIPVSKSYAAEVTQRFAEKN
ncbi:MAG: LytTR family transcriptional regulator [Bacteroidales bacterium]|nr:LytTR family transcriptional regulator [Bacteroidales bacterium]